MDQIT